MFVVVFFFLWREVNRKTRRKTLEVRPEETTTSTHIIHCARIVLGHIGGRRVIIPGSDHMVKSL